MSRCVVSFKRAASQQGPFFFSPTFYGITGHARVPRTRCLIDDRGLRYPMCMHQETSRGLNALNYLVISDKYIKTTKKCIIHLIHLGNCPLMHASFTSALSNAYIQSNCKLHIVWLRLGKTQRIRKLEITYSYFLYFFCSILGQFENYTDFSHK